MSRGVEEASGERLAAISNAVVGIFSEYYGRGPTKAKSYVVDNYVLCVLDDILTTVERTLVERARRTSSAKCGRRSRRRWRTRSRRPSARSWGARSSPTTAT
jgi:uncharacterized protein YbcI